MATTSLFMLAHVGSHLGLQVATMDIGGAYLNASREGCKPVFIQLNQLITEIMAALYPSLRPFVSERGFLIMEAKKALYGTLDAGKLWNEELTGTLTKDLGLAQHPQDPCMLV